MRTPSVLILLATVLASGAGCAVKRDVGPGRSIEQYDYAVLTPQTSREYYEKASAILDQPFVVVTEEDPRLELPRVRQKACTVTVDWAPGFWSTSGWVEVKDYAHGTHVLTSHMRRGMLWTGANEDVMIAIRDVAAARAAGPPLPADARNPSAEPATGRTTAQRLEELNDLKERGLISEGEYSAQRKNILKEH
jgi:hypothetical protein